MARSRFKTFPFLCAFQAALLLGALRPFAAMIDTGTIDPCKGGAAAINPACNQGSAPGTARGSGPGLVILPGKGNGTMTGTDPPPSGGGLNLPPHSNFLLIPPKENAPPPVDPKKGGSPGGSSGSARTSGGALAARAPAVTGFPGSGSPLTIKAGLQLQLGDLPAACETAGAALKQDPKDAKAAKIEGLACRGGFVSGPKGAPNEDLKSGPANRDVTVDMNARSRLLRGERSGGAVTGPGALQVWIARVGETKERGEDDQIILLCDEALREFPGNLHLLNAKATAQNKLKDFKGALVTANEALDLDGKNAVAYANKAFALGGLGDREGMLAALRAAAALDPRFEAAFKAALAGDAAGLFGPGSKLAGKPAPMLTWILASAGAGFLLMLFLVAAARRSMPRSVATPPAPFVRREIEAGRVLGGNFRVDGELGRGGMGVVYDAFDEKLQRRVAIKQFQRDASTTPDDVARFIKEARLVAQLKHPNLTEIYTVLEEKGDLLLVFEHIDGRTLDKVIAANRRLPLAQTGKILGEIAAALDYAHALKIIHRDLKPSNVMITRGGAVKVMDFGIAHQAATTGLTRTEASGTPPYMSPEQGMGSVSKATDLYSLGVMTYEMVSGVRPFEGPDFLEQKLRKAYAPVVSREGALPPGLDAFFAAVLDPDPTKRPASGTAFVEAFRLAC